VGWGTAGPGRSRADSRPCGRAGGHGKPCADSTWPVVAAAAPLPGVRTDGVAGTFGRKKWSSRAAETGDRAAFHAETTMLTLYDYLPSQNAWKVRQLLHHLGLQHRTQYVSIFEGEGRREAFLRISPTGTVPAIELDDGRALAESNAILCFLA